jgi:hypothetical protein
MRIVSGALKGRSLAAPPGQGTRPTSDRARQAVFNILEHAAWAPPLADARVIDLFAGSGALGFEALSRGAAFCLFVETEAAARGAIRDNAEAFALFGRTRIHRRDATDLGAAGWRPAPSPSWKPAPPSPPPWPPATPSSTPEPGAPQRSGSCSWRTARCSREHPASCDRRIGPVTNPI